MSASSNQPNVPNRPELGEELPVVPNMTGLSQAPPVRRRPGIVSGLGSPKTTGSSAPGWGPSSSLSQSEKFANVLRDMLMRLEAAPAGIPPGDIEDGRYMRSDPMPAYSLTGTALSDLLGRGLAKEERERVVITAEGRAILAEFLEPVTPAANSYAPSPPSGGLNVGGIAETDFVRGGGSAPPEAGSATDAPGPFTIGSSYVGGGDYIVGRDQSAPEAPTDEPPPSLPAQPASGADDRRDAVISGMPATAVADGPPGEVQITAGATLNLEAAVAQVTSAGVWYRHLPPEAPSALRALAARKKAIETMEEAVLELAAQGWTGAEGGVMEELALPALAALIEILKMGDAVVAQWESLKDDVAEGLGRIDLAAKIMEHATLGANALSILASVLAIAETLMK